MQNPPWQGDGSWRAVFRARIRTLGGEWRRQPSVTRRTSARLWSVVPLRGLWSPRPHALVLLAKALQALHRVALQSRRTPYALDSKGTASRRSSGSLPPPRAARQQRHISTCLDMPTISSGRCLLLGIPEARKPLSRSAASGADQMMSEATGRPSNAALTPLSPPLEGHAVPLVGRMQRSERLYRRSGAFRHHVSKIPDLRQERHARFFTLSAYPNGGAHMVKEIPARLVAFPCRLHGAAVHGRQGPGARRAAPFTLRLDHVGRIRGC